MKKIILTAMFAFAATICGYQSFASEKTSNMSDIAKANVEAIAGVNWGGFCCNDATTGCYQSLGEGATLIVEGLVNCPDPHISEY